MNKCLQCLWFLQKTLAIHVLSYLLQDSSDVYATLRCVIFEEPKACFTLATNYFVVLRDQVTKLRWGGRDHLDCKIWPRCPDEGCTAAYSKALGQKQPNVF